MSGSLNIELQCPVPIREYPAVQLAHGGGGRLMNQLIEKLFVAAFNNEYLSQKHDAAQIERPTGRIAMTTDSFVVRPLFFPGGSIGELAVYGTANDLAMAGARPLYLTAGFILEEGLKMEALWRVVQDMARAAEKAGVKIVTGDTKVVDRGKGDGVYINTSGVGVIADGVDVGPHSIRPGDRIILNGDLGRHGMAIMAVREGLEFESEIKSDAAPLSGAVQSLINAGIPIRCLRDLTRGGLASALNELADASRHAIHVVEESIPIREDVRGACEILGFDPLYVANEGRFITFVPESHAAQTVSILKRHFPDTQPVDVGQVVEAGSPQVILKNRFGADRILDLLSGDQLPRIC